ncbi:MAG: peptide deformylase [Verrucomicrobiales bacterium]
MILDIVMYGDPVLRAKCARVDEITAETKELADNMMETMRDAQGVGLAAPQIGVPIQLAIVDVSHDPECITFLKIDGEESTLEEAMPFVFVNPQIDYGDDKETCSEGCLSFPDLQGDIRRPEAIKVRFTLLDGREVEVETDGLLARAIQHETDHLNGVLFIDRMSTASKSALRGRLKRLQKQFNKR